MNRNNRNIREPLVEALAKSPMLQFLGKHEGHLPGLRDMIESGKLYSFPKGQTIIRQGDPSEAFYVLASGSVEVVYDGNTICTMEQPGELFGEFGALTGELRSATVKAREEVTCFGIPAQASDVDGAGDNPVFHGLLQQAFIKILLGRVQQSNEEAVEYKRALENAERQIAFLKVDNETLSKQLDEAREARNEGLRGTRGTGESET